MKSTTFNRRFAIVQSATVVQAATVLAAVVWLSAGWQSAAVAGGAGGASGAHGAHAAHANGSVFGSPHGLNLLGSSTGGGLGLEFHDPRFAMNFPNGNHNDHFAFNNGGFGEGGFGNCGFGGCGFGAFGDCGWGGCGGYGYGLNDELPIPYFAMYPPVRYSYPVPRTFGYSPFAYPGYVMTPPVIEDSGPAEIVNPYAPPSGAKPSDKTPEPLPAKPAPKAKATGEEINKTADSTGDNSKMIINPFVSSELAASGN